MRPALSRLVTALLLPLALVAGLLTFPTTCACGSSLPHDHPLLALAGHHHDELEHSQPQPHAHAPTQLHTHHNAAGDVATDAEDTDQHQLTAPTAGSGIGRAPLAPVGLAPATLPATRSPRRRPARAARPAGAPITPDDPPPQPPAPC